MKRKKRSISDKERNRWAVPSKNYKGRVAVWTDAGWHHYTIGAARKLSRDLRHYLALRADRASRKEK